MHQENEACNEQFGWVPADHGGATRNEDANYCGLGGRHTRRMGDFRRATAARDARWRHGPGRDELVARRAGQPGAERGAGATNARVSLLRAKRHWNATKPVLW